MARAKQVVREEVWALLTREGVARFPGAHGRIPNFAGTERAAERLAELPEWRAARVIKSNPDAPQLPVRRRALAEGKTVYMAVPRLAAAKPFLRLRDDATVRARNAVPVAIDELERIELVISGSVAVNRAGVRIGKGEGFADLELALLAEAGLLDEQTILATTVHALQVRAGALPETEHDFRLDVVITPDEIIRAKGRRPRPRLLWLHLDPEKIEAIPVLAGRVRRS